MVEIIQFVSDHQFALYLVFSAVVSCLPTPKEEERWYGFAYQILHLGAANIAKVFPKLRAGQGRLCT